MLHPIAVDRRWPKGFGRPAMCVSSADPFSVEKASKSEVLTAMKFPALADHRDEPLPVQRAVRSAVRRSYRRPIGARRVARRTWVHDDCRQFSKIPCVPSRAHERSGMVKLEVDDYDEFKKRFDSEPGGRKG